MDEMGLEHRDFIFWGIFSQLPPMHLFIYLTPLLLLLTTLLPPAESGFFHKMAESMGWGHDHHHDGWESKGVTFGLKSKGMTAIIPFPLPIPIFKKNKDSGGSGGDKGGGDKGGGGGGWEQPAGGNDWWK
ncbi:hypothetical protein JTE90_004784 [Oedothorax gibbosus]|uniref:Glycine-rich protein n=1 Tax=Oedothorax gibbosus TaxID=931172 RepID=A0AAV6VI26_9ARAC|nr:hypothetical protein JTE90_004784 [Oedothorax gibbosus]